MKRYTLWNFIVDCILTMLTSGFWLIWIFIRENRKKNERYDQYHNRCNHRPY